MWRDEAYLLDILLAARKIVKFSQGYDAQKFASDELLQHAVMRLIKSWVRLPVTSPRPTKRPTPRFPGPRSSAGATALVYEYFRVETESVWEAVVKDIPALVTLIEPLIQPE
jgi:uncharacterized protein with HEPN domain